jgi:methyltransferase (TIGR00027 family)
LHGADSIERARSLLGVHRTIRDIRDGVVRIKGGNTGNFKPGAITTMEEQLQEVESGPGHTATLAAVGRAIHSQGDRPLLTDHLALGLAGEAGTTLLAQLTAQLPEASRQSFGLAFAIRARFVEDAVEVAIRDGIEQYVILGAGLDSFAYRRPDLSGRLAIFEVDRSESQAWKRRRLKEMGVAIPTSVTYVPADLSSGSLRQPLVDAGFDPTRPAIVSAIALTQYLAQPAIEEMLQLASSFGAGSRLVITYVVPETELGELAAAGLKWTMSQAEERGEPFLSLFRTGDFEDLLRRSGFARVDEAGAEELRKAYLADRPDAQLTGIERVVTAYV